MIALPNISLAFAAKLGGFLLLALALTLLVRDRNHWKSSADLRQQQLARTQAAFDQTVAGYRTAAAQARAEDAANVARAKSEQTAINERTADEYETRVATARADAQRLRHYAAAAADSGAGRGAPVPGLPATASGTAEATSEDELPADDSELATEQAIQLDELIKWVDQQHAINLNQGTSR